MVARRASGGVRVPRRPLARRPDRRRADVGVPRDGAHRRRQPADPGRQPAHPTRHSIARTPTCTARSSRRTRTTTGSSSTRSISAARTLGHSYLRDVDQLRSGQDWQREIERYIDQADIFQLFWSPRSMYSPHVRHEWTYALSLGRPDFIRPVYWQSPRPSAPPDLPPPELDRLHFMYLAGDEAPAGHRLRRCVTRERAAGHRLVGHRAATAPPGAMPPAAMPPGAPAGRRRSADSPARPPVSRSRPRRPPPSRWELPGRRRPSVSGTARCCRRRVRRRRQSPPRRRARSATRPGHRAADRCRI